MTTIETCNRIDEHRHTDAEIIHFLRSTEAEHSSEYLALHQSPEHRRIFAAVYNVPPRLDTVGDFVVHNSLLQHLWCDDPSREAEGLELVDRWYANDELSAAVSLGISIETLRARHWESSPHGQEIGRKLLARCRAGVTTDFVDAHVVAAYGNTWRDLVTFRAGGHELAA